MSDESDPFYFLTAVFTAAFTSLIWCIVMFGVCGNLRQSAINRGYAEMRIDSTKTDTKPVFTWIEPKDAVK
jgi:hypothetical protein